MSTPDEHEDVNMPEGRMKRLLLARGNAGRLDYVHNDIAAIHASALERKMLGPSTANYPKSLLITGDPGIGKTEIINKYVQQFEPKEAGSRRIIRAFSAIIPARATIRAVTAALLDGAGAPSPDQGDATQLARRLAKILVQCGVEIIVLDEFQHLIANRRSDPVSDVADWLKTIINMTGIPIVVVGLPSSRAVLDQNAQLARRFKRVRELQPFNLHFDDERQELAAFLASYEKAIKFPEPTKFGSSYWLKRIYIASAGRIGHIADLVQEAGRRAIHEDARAITEEHMAAAYYDILSDTSPAAGNPFELEVEAADAAYRQVLSTFDRHRKRSHP